MSTQIITRSKSTHLNTNTKTSISIQNKCHQQPKTTKTTPLQIKPKDTKNFAFSRLPLEIQHEIYSHYFASLSPIAATSFSSSTPSYYDKIPLVLASPFFVHAIPQSLFYAHTTFTFSSPSLLAKFANDSSKPEAKRTRHVRIMYGDVGKEGPDWVFVLLECLREVESVVFVVQRGVRDGEERFGEWWRCVRGAVREGVAARKEVMRTRRDRGMLLGVEDEDEGEVVRELVGGVERG